MDVVDIVNVSDIDIVIDIVELQVNTLKKKNFEILIFMIQIGNDQAHLVYPFGSQGSGTTTHPHCSQAAGLAPRYYPCQHTWGCPVLVCPAKFANSSPARL